MRRFLSRMSFPRRTDQPSAVSLVIRPYLFVFFSLR